MYIDHWLNLNFVLINFYYFTQFFFNMNVAIILIKLKNDKIIIVKYWLSFFNNNFL